MFYFLLVEDVSVRHMALLQSDDMLRDEIMSDFIEILKLQFPSIMGLSQPIPREKDLTRWPKPYGEHTTYESCNNSAYIPIYYIQGMTTG